MIIKSIRFKNGGFVECRSGFYTASDVLQTGKTDFMFSTGVNKMVDEIDSGIWAASYMLSMYKYRPKDFIPFEQPGVIVNDSIVMSLNEMSKYSCYMDLLYPLFSGEESVRALINKGIKENNLNYSAKDIKDLFGLDPERFERRLSWVGNEKFRAMAAIGLCHGKQVFCFPWLSAERFNSYHRNMTFTLEMLEKFEKIVILPVGKP